MLDLSALGAFFAAAFLLNIAPGPDMLYVIGRSIGQGRRAGTVSALGIFVGCLVHILLQQLDWRLSSVHHRFCLTLCDMPGRATSLSRPADIPWTK